jgi:small GTP-binding protein
MFNFFKKNPEKQIEDNTYTQFTDLYHHKFKLVIIGDCSVGKSSILYRLSNNSFLTNYNPTIGVDFSSKIIEYSNGTKVKLLVWDTAGQERFKSITKNYYHDTHAYLLVFDLSDSGSFENLQYWIKEIKEYTNTSIFLIGTKKDLMKDTLITSFLINKFIEENNIINYFEVSSKTSSNIDNLFHEIGNYLTNIKIKNIETNKVNINLVPVVNTKCCLWT